MTNKLGLGKIIPIHHVTPGVWEKFAALDTNKDGHIDYNELLRLTEALGVRFARRELKTAFHVMDTDKSGEITLGVFAKWWAEQVRSSLL